MTCGRGLAATLAAMLSAGNAAAQEQNRSDQAPQISPESAAYVDGLFFNDARERLSNQGIDPHVSYVTESSAAVDGARGTRYTGQFEVGAAFNLGKLGLIGGGKFNIVFNNREGADLSTDKIHNLFRVQEVFGANKDVRLVYLTYEQTFAEDRVSVLAGRTNLGEDFAYSKLFCNFQQNGICGRPRSLVTNGAFSNYPLSVWGGRLKVKPFGGASYIQTGAYEVNPDSANNDGFNFGTSHDTGAVIPIEFDWVSGSESSGTLGNVKFGGYYDTSRVNDLVQDASGRPYVLTGATPLSHRGRATGYVMLDKAVARLGGNAKRPVTLLVGATVAQSDRSFFDHFWYAAAIFKGPFAAREQDTLGLLVLSGHVSAGVAETERLRALVPQHTETVAEANYNVRVTSWLHLVPGVQYIVDPNGEPRRANVTVLNLKTQFNF